MMPINNEHKANITNKIEKIFSLLNPTDAIKVNLPLAHNLGLNEAIIYSTLLSKYINLKKENQLDLDEFFPMSVYEIQEQTILTENQQRRAINTLMVRGLIVVKRKGLPAKRFFKLELDNLARYLRPSNLKTKYRDENL